MLSRWHVYCHCEQFQQQDSITPQTANNTRELSRVMINLLTPEDAFMSPLAAARLLGRQGKNRTLPFNGNL